jgi:hypothetical protein
MRAQGLVKNYYSMILSGEWDPLFEFLTEEFYMDTPMYGRVQGTEELKQLFQQQRERLKGYMAKQEVLAATMTHEQMVVEFILHFTVNGKAVELPVAIAADRNAEKISAMRIYHSAKPLTGKHHLRAPLLKPAAYLGKPRVIDQYLSAIAKPDLEAIPKLFEDDGYVRESDGAHSIHKGDKALHRFYESMLAKGGMGYKFCSETFDGDRCAIEYICNQWGTQKLEPQCGITVYEIGPFGKIAAVRIYDDIAADAH